MAFLLPVGKPNTKPAVLSTTLKPVAVVVLQIAHRLNAVGTAARSSEENTRVLAQCAAE